ncbi:fungal-specific transcription factor domain-containing protein [Gloeopeniophorella convolvens]|nr:fungal-specific transcription factor domain-containing protein [Gloeopeniophorella convolvens]
MSVQRVIDENSRYVRQRGVPCAVVGLTCRLQCDRGHPCSRCVNRGSADSCSYEEPKELGKRKSVVLRVISDSSCSRPGLTIPCTHQAVRDGLRGLDTTPRTPNSLQSVPNSVNTLEQTALAGLDVLLQVLHSANAGIASPQAAELFGLTKEPEPACLQVADSAVQVAVTALNQLSQQSDSPESLSPFAPVAGIVQHVRLRGFGTPTPLSELQRHFPNQKITAFLLTYYFDKSSCHWMFPVIHRPCFENYYRTFSAGPLPPSIEFVALLAITCATALQFLPESHKDAITLAEYPAGRKVLQQRLVDFARSVLFTCTEYPLSSLERVQALLLFSVYQWNEANAGESWYIASLAIRMAQTLALNRDGTTTWQMRPEDAEIRRRLWWTLFLMDRIHNMEYRRPYIIFEQHTDVALPMNLDQVDVVDTPGLTGKPVEEATDSLYHLYHCKIHRLSGRIWDACFSVALPTYRMIMDFEEELRKFDLDLPTSLRYQTTQVALARPYLAFQYKMLTMEVTYHRAQLLRPFLFIHPTKERDFDGLSEQDRKLSVFHKHARAICIAFCKRQLALLQLIQSAAEPGHMVWSGLSLAAFKPALTLAIAIIMDTQNPENEELEEWIAFAQGILVDLKPYNTLAQKALDHLDVIRKRTTFVLGVVTGHCQASDPDDPSSTGIAPAMSLAQRLDGATRTLSQPQSCMLDHLGREEAANPLWSTLHPGVFAGHFPGIESLSGPVNPQNLEHFLDSCLSMHSRLPHTFTF